MSIISIEKKLMFSSAHRLYNDALTESENEALYGHCVRWHGHNYTIWVTYRGEINPKTGLFINFYDLDEVLSTLTKKFDHLNLNEDVAELKSLMTTVENIAVVSWDLLKKARFGESLYNIRLEEIEGCVVEYSGPE